MAGRAARLHAAAALGLFLIWSNSFVAASFLLGGERGPVRFDWITLSVARFAPIGPLCLLWCFAVKRRETLRLLRHFPVRITMGSLLAVPCYNLALYYGQQHGVPPPVASLTTALVPLFVMLLAAIVLGEALTLRRVVAFGVALAGLGVITASKGGLGAVGEYGLLLGVTAMAPLSWSIYSILSKPVAGAASPLTWTYLSIGLGSLPLLAVLPWRGGEELLALSAGGWAALLYLSVLCTVVGYAVWCWLLRFLPASTVGFTVFLNPPLTTLSKLALAALFPAVFVWSLEPVELLGGGLTLAGLGLAVGPRRRGELRSGWRSHR